MKYTIFWNSYTNMNNLIIKKTTQTTMLEFYTMEQRGKTWGNRLNQSNLLI